MTTQVITNKMLYELLKDFKEDVHKRFEQVDKRLEQVDKRFEQVDRRFEHLENQQAEDHKILIELWENRSRQNLNFTSTYFLITFFSSILVSLLASYSLISALN